MSEELVEHEVAQEQAFVDRVYVQLASSARAAQQLAREGYERGRLGHEGGLTGGTARWPVADRELARKDELEIPVQINGKLRGRIRAALDTIFI